MIQQNNDHAHYMSKKDCQLLNNELIIKMDKTFWTNSMHKFEGAISGPIWALTFYRVKNQNLDLLLNKIQTQNNIKMPKSGGYIIKIQIMEKKQSLDFLLNKIQIKSRFRTKKI